MMFYMAGMLFTFGYLMDEDIVWYKAVFLLWLWPLFWGQEFREIINSKKDKKR